MQPSDKQKPHLLSDQRNAFIYDNLINERLLKPLKPNENKLPTAIYLAGQPGSGKTVLRNHLLSDAAFRKSTLVINTDELRDYHPAYRELLAHPRNYADAPFLVNPDSVKWAEKLRQDAVKQKHNLVFDVTLGGNAENYIKSMNDLKVLGYQIQVAVLAVNKDLSRLGIHLRYERQLEAEGAGRFVNMNVHDTNYKNLTKNLVDIMKAVDLDGVSVYKRRIFSKDSQLVNNAVEKLHEFNKVKDNQQVVSSYDLIVNAIDRERERKWSPVEQEYLNMRIDQVEQLLEKRSGNIPKFREDIKSLVDSITSDSQHRSRKI